MKNTDKPKEITVSSGGTLFVDSRTINITINIDGKSEPENTQNLISRIKETVISAPIFSPVKQRRK